MLFDRYVKTSTPEASMTIDSDADEAEYDPIFDDEGDGDVTHHPGEEAAAGESGLPSYLLNLLSVVNNLMIPHLPSDIIQTVFSQPLARQVIINLYPAGQGIASHVDLPHRYADGILGVSLCGGCSMTMTDTKTGRDRHVWLPSNSVYVLTGDSRWDWAHGIPAQAVDRVQDVEARIRSVIRDLRVSVTYRWMKADAMDLVEPAAGQGRR